MSVDIDHKLIYERRTEGVNLPDFDELILARRLQLYIEEDGSVVALLTEGGDTSVIRLERDALDAIAAARVA